MPITSSAVPPDARPPCRSIRIVVVISPPILVTNVFIAASAIPEPCALGVILNMVAAVPKLALFAPVDVPAATMLSLPDVATF